MGRPSLGATRGIRGCGWGASTANLTTACGTNMRTYREVGGAPCRTTTRGSTATSNAAAEMSNGGLLLPRAIATILRHD